MQIEVDLPEKKLISVEDGSQAETPVPDRTSLFTSEHKEVRNMNP